MPRPPDVILRVILDGITRRIPCGIPLRSHQAPCHSGTAARHTHRTLRNTCSSSWYSVGIPWGIPKSLWEYHKDYIWDNMHSVTTPGIPVGISLGLPVIPSPVREYHLGYHLEYSVIPSQVRNTIRNTPWITCSSETGRGIPFLGQMRLSHWTRNSNMVFQLYSLLTQDSTQDILELH